MALFAGEERREDKQGFFGCFKVFDASLPQEGGTRTDNAESTDSYPNV